MHLPHAILREGQALQGDDRSLLPWWSIAKSVLAAAMLRLCDQGRLALDDRYDDWPFTIRQLLKHTSGLNTYGGAAYHDAVAKGDAAWSTEDVLVRVKPRQLLFRPGEGWAYSNIGYLFVRLLIERMMGCDLNQALQTLVFKPLGITKTFVAMTPEDLLRTAWGNTENYHPGWVYHGLLVGPPADAVRFLHGMLNPGFLSDAMRAAMLERHDLGGEIPGRPWQSHGYGLGLMMGDFRSGDYAIGHTGGGPMSVSALYAFPNRSDKAIVAVFAPQPDQAIVEDAALRLAADHSAGCCQPPPSAL